MTTRQGHGNSPAWQPIETAPKDGRVVLIAAVGGPVDRGYWWGEDDTSIGHWFIAGRRGHNNPTHWMPLPDPPGQKEEHNDGAWLIHQTIPDMAGTEPRPTVQDERAGTGSTLIGPPSECVSARSDSSMTPVRTPQHDDNTCGIEYEPGYLCGRPKGHRWECCAHPAACLDCGRDYSEFGLDLLLPRSQWCEILSQTRERPDLDDNDGGVLCAQCMVTRASKVGGANCIHAVIEINPHRQVGCAEGVNERSESSATLPSEAPNASSDPSAAVKTETLPNRENSPHPATTGQLSKQFAVSGERLAAVRDRIRMEGYRAPRGLVPSTERMAFLSGIDFAVFCINQELANPVAEPADAPRRSNAPET